MADSAAGGDGAPASDGAPTDSSQTDAPPNQVTCPGSMCGSVCCEGTCVDAIASICAGKTFRCDGPEDCNAGDVCCNDQNGSVCAASCSGGKESCHTTADCSFSCNDCSFRSDYGQNVCCE